MSKQRINKARFWVGVLYVENMVENWETEIGDILQVPYAYCIHDKDKDEKEEDRKIHVHLQIAFPNTTTYNHALNVYSLLNADGKIAVNTVQACISVRGSYDYLIHDTETCKKKGKHLYDKSERKTGNNFDIGSYEQLDIAQKNDICRELCKVISDNGFYNFADFFDFVLDNFEDAAYFEVLKANNGLFERLTKGNFQRIRQSQVKTSL